MKDIQNFIDGRFVPSARWFEKTAPYDGKPIARVAEADRALVDQAVRAARAALSGPWAGLALTQRAALLHDIERRGRCSQGKHTRLDSRNRQGELGYRRHIGQGSWSLTGESSI